MKIKSESRIDKLPEQMRNRLYKMLNESQREAVEAAMDTEELILIQGPPGTGKTSTVLGLLAIVLYSQKEESDTTSRQSVLTENQLLLNWHGQCPWLTRSNPRDLIDPMGTDSGADKDCFGLLNGQQIPAVTIGCKVVKKTNVLVCAPSNSALDEILMRVIDMGLVGVDGNMWKPGVVRVGQKKHHSVSHVHLDNLVIARLTQDSQKVSLQDQYARRFERGRLRSLVMEEADIVFSTLSYCGSGVFASLTKKFDIVIIDEAAQAVEPSILVPLTLGCRKAILIGDPVQLPATVISARATQYGYDQSLFKRLFQNGYPTQMLKTQYRMHPAISTFPAQQFYHGILEDGPSVTEKNSKPWHQYKCFGPMTFFDVHGEEQLPENGISIYNMHEVQFIISLFKQMLTKFPDMKKTSSVAFITPYRAQVDSLKRGVLEDLGEDIAKWVDVNTIDGFQGREKDLVIFSAVRTGVRHSIGFVADERRLNVAITRARSSLLIVGNVAALVNDENWRLLVRNTKARRCMYDVRCPYHEYIKDLITGFVQPVEPSEEDICAQKSRDYIPRLEDEETPVDIDYK